MPAKFYLDRKGIHANSWYYVQFLLPGDNMRYNLIMDDNSCKAYIANGIEARQE